jgi:hypothetical protein
LVFSLTNTNYIINLLRQESVSRIKTLHPRRKRMKGDLSWQSASPLICTINAFAVWTEFQGISRGKAQ